MTEPKKRKAGGGRKSNAEKGMEPTVVTSIRMARSVINKAIELHGGLQQAVLFASENPPKNEN